MKNKRRIFACVIFAILLVSMNVCSALEVEVSMKINDNYVKSDKKNILIDDRVFVLARFVVEALNGKITWIDKTREIVIDYEGKNMKLTIGSDIAYINGKEYKLDLKPFIREGRTYIPLRFVSENLNCDVKWVQDTFTVDIRKEGLEIAKEKFEKRSYTDEDMLWIARIVEVGNTSLESRIAIANVVLNRVKSNKFPNSVYEVIFQGKQFPPAHKESFKSLKPSNISSIAAKKALEGINNIEECLFFNSRPFKSKSKDFYKKIDGEYFYK
ncbi:stalk domain-containing protein [Tepidibacter formicigenes]|jgi:hypothetical protein|uniref:Copper amine oxidase N-terminal domain-containing protein n=1 Tax=Tepidibacter formicigenes DSM 15518 TaxID=1123349 RepID=A0A1M6PK16_9FIRM|nr:stalk domain-containing protein [Tepidibacter formicigenes]SHK08270.1 Copper amine oxidase N-terminal domain-containing protein [Tepidibacter formicigenes DSM 15518]